MLPLVCFLTTAFIRILIMNESQLKKALKPFKMEESVSDGYTRLYKKFQQGQKKISRWKFLRSPDEKKLVHYDSLSIPERDSLEALLARIAICKLNGGLGTSMGCHGSKSAIVVRDEMTFVDLIIKQVDDLNNKYQGDVPLIFMNSFYTYEETERIIGRNTSSSKIMSFCQNQYPRLLEDESGFFGNKKINTDSWYPAGHGDLYLCLLKNGILDRLLKEGREYLFVSNADNLGAIVDLKIANHIINEDIPFLMEVTPKTTADTKGGVLCQEKDRIKLLEIANVPPEHIPEFCGNEKFKFFNTNNLWINLVKLKELTRDNPLDLELIINRKQIKNKMVLQFETAVGDAINTFNGAVGMNVPRDRFLPVKKTSDLLLVQSDLFNLERGTLKRNLKVKRTNLPRINFRDPFNNLKEYQKRIPVTPDIKELDSLELKGEVFFNGKVTLKGKVRLISDKKPLRISKGTVLTDKVVEQ